MSRRSLILIGVGVLALIPRAGRAPLAQRLLVPFIAGVLVRLLQDRLRDAPRRFSPLGPPLLLLGLVMNLAGLRLDGAFLEPFGLVLAVAGLGFWLLGGAVMRVLAFPTAFLLFLVPWQDLLAPVLARPMQALTGLAVCRLAAITGLHVRLEGLTLFAPGFWLVIQVPCSGLRSLMALMALAALYAHFTQAPLGRRCLLFVVGVPMALAMNIVRIWLILLAGHLFGWHVAMAFFHEYSAPLLFLMNVFGLQALKGALERDAQSPPQSPADETATLSVPGPTAVPSATPDRS